MCYVDAVHTCFQRFISLSAMESAACFHEFEVLDEYTQHFL